LAASTVLERVGSCEDRRHHPELQEPLIKFIEFLGDASLLFECGNVSQNLIFWLFSESP
jgi:hypothetical protein